MTTAEAIYSKLAAATAVAALVGSGIYPLQAPQGASFPYVIFQHIGSTVAATHKEAASSNLRLFQFASFAATYEAATALRDAVTAALDTNALDTGESPTLDDERDADFDEVANVYRADCDFLV